jgi:hypothetical protein
MQPQLNAWAALLLHEERLREADRHRRNTGERRRSRLRRWWDGRGRGGPGGRGGRGLRRGDHTLAG